MNPDFSDYDFWIGKLREALASGQYKDALLYAEEASNSRKQIQNVPKS